MKTLSRIQIQLFVGMMFCILSRSSDAAGVIKTTLLGCPDDGATTFGVLVEVSQNDDLVSTSSVPVAYALRINYPTNSVTYIAAYAAKEHGFPNGDLGPMYSTVEQGVAPDRYRNIASLGNFANTDPTPQCFYVYFQRTTSPSVPFTITVIDNPSSSAPLMTAAGVNLPHTFDCSETTGIGNRPPCRIGDWRLCR